MIMSRHNDNGANEVLLGCSSNLYRQDDAAAGPPNIRAVVVRAIQHPFDISTTTTNTTTNNTSSKSPGGMAAALGYAAAFTSAQWKELERQAMIYKYMVASVPVPPHLLLPTADSSAPHSPLGSGCGDMFNLKFGNNKDPELGRCKRTDGKKWRCSRDVAPHQKYCERHMHRGRPRSRKPVEVPPNNIKKKTRLHLHTHPTPTPKRLLRSTIPPNEIENSCSLLLDSTKTSEHLYVLPYGEQSHRGLDWMVEGEMVTTDTSEQQWQQLMTEASIYSTTAPSIFQRSYGEEEPMNLLSLPDIVSNSPDEFNLFLHSYQPPRDFIDSWSNHSSNNESNNNQSSVTAANGNLSPSLLNLSMAMAVGNSLDHEIGQIQMGLDVARAANHHHKSQVSSGLNPVSTPGGPLAEVLRPSSVAIGSNPGSPCRRN